MARVERVPAPELQCESVVHLIAEQRLLASDAAPADREHARAVGELRLEPADGLIESRRLQVVEDLRADDQIPLAWRGFLGEAGAEQIDIPHSP